LSPINKHRNALNKKASTMKNHRLFIIKYVGATNTKPSRVKITDLCHRKARFIPYDHSKNNTHEMAETYLKSKGIKCGIMGEADALNGYILGTKNFTDQI
jgi:hypothetical protein